MSKFFHFGVSQEKEGYKKPAIVLTNQFSFIQLITGVAFTFVIYRYVPELIFLPIGFCLAICIVMFLNFVGLNDIGRFSFVFSNALFFSLLHAFSLDPGDPLINHLYFAQLCLVVLPWLIIDLREGFFIYLATLVVLLFFSLQPFFIESVSLEMNVAFFRSSYFEYTTYAIVLIGVCVVLYLINSKIASNETGAQNGLAEIDRMSKEMERRESDLQERIKEINETNKAEEELSWVSQNASEISDLIRNTKEEDIYFKLTESLVKILDANQVAIYTLDDESNKNKFLKLESCYAIDRHKFLEQRLPFDAGLVGQSCKEKEFIFLDNLPPGHVKYTSGLGEEPPKNMALVPLVENERLSGLVEVISHNKFEKKEQDFLKQTSEIIASFIISNMVNIKIRELIEQNQVQAEEMKAQEEEMMQNMEELQATQEEMSRKEKEYLEKIRTLEKELEEKQVL